jgi:DNA-binding CsgD family transcriptional regulator
VEQAESVGLLRIRDGAVEFRHPLIRSVAFQMATSAQQRAAHAAVAEVLTGARDADRRAWHLASAVVGRSDEVAAALEDAARAARARSAYAAAATAFERAAQLSTGDEAQAQRLFAAAEAAWLAGGAERSIRLLDQARERTKETLLGAEIEHLRGRAVSRCGSVLSGHDILVEAAMRIQAVDSVGATAMLAEAAIPLCQLGAGEKMLKTAQKAWDIAAGVHDERATFFASLATGTALIFSGHRDQEGARLLRQAASYIERTESLRGNPHMAIWAGVAPLWLRDNSRGRDALFRAIDLARERGALGELPFALNQLALDSASSDRWAAAHAEFSELIHLAQETGQPIMKCQGVAGLCRLEARQGHVDDCRAHASEALELADRFGLGLFRIWVTLGLADLALGLAQYQDAIRHGEAVRAWLTELRIGDPDLSPVPELVLAYVRLGRVADANVASREFIQRAEEKGQPWSLARAARCRGLLSDEPAFENHFVDALTYHAQTLDSFERARTCLQFGERLRRTRRRTQAREQLRQAYETFERLGAVPWAEQAHVELLATGETARRRDASTMDQLTPQEFQVAQLLAHGATTREAAAKLFLSPKTIEYHLRSVYSKLGIRTRSALANLLVDQANSGVPTA